MEAAVSLTDTVGMNFGIWNSFHDAQTGAGRNGPGPDSWYEADLYIGLSFDVAQNCQLGVTYTAYTSPNDAFGDIHEIALSASHDDSAAWEGTALASGLQPSITLAFELDGSALGPDEGIYLEIAIEPSFKIIESQDYPVTLSIPITLGLSITDYYEGTAGTFPRLDPNNSSDPNFGYLDVGAVLSMPLSAIPADYGQWEVSVGLHWMLLNENTELANNGDESEFVATFGISMGY